VYGAVACHGATGGIDPQNNFPVGASHLTAAKLTTTQTSRKESTRGKVRMQLDENSVSTLSTAINSAGESQSRFFLKVSDIVTPILQEKVESLPPAFRDPLLFLLGFGQQSIENIMSDMRSFSQMIITSLVMMAVKRIFFSNLPTEADRNKASELTDSILDMVDLVI